MGNPNALVAGKRQKQKFSVALQTESFQNMIKATLHDTEKEKAFNKGIISAVLSNPQLQECTNASILGSGLQGASLDLNPAPEFGQFYLVPYKNQLKDANGNKLWVVDENGNKVKDEKGKWIPVTESVATFQIGYRGMIQLATRTGQYFKLNVVEIKEGELRSFDPLNEVIDCVIIEDFDKREATPTIGYYAMFEYKYGFRKAIYWSKQKMINHADKYSPAFSAVEYKKLLAGEVKDSDMWKYSSFWYKDFDTMAKKTMLRQLIGKWGIISTEMQQAIIQDEKPVVARFDGNEIVVDDLSVVDDVATDVSESSDFTEVVEQVNLKDL